MKRREPPSILVVSLLISMLAYSCDSAVSASSFTANGQVGVDSRGSKKTPPRKTSSKRRDPTKATKKPDQPPEQAPIGKLILRADLNCRVTVDGQFVDELAENQSKELTVKPGQHTVSANTLDGLYRWSGVFQVQESKSVPVNVELKKEKAAAEAAKALAEKKAQEEQKALNERKARGAQEAARLEEEKNKIEYEATRKQRITDRAKRDGFVSIPAGLFSMGSKSGDAAEAPVHRVNISQGFEMAKFEVSQAKWEEVMDKNHSRFKGAQRPVENVSYEDVQEFIRRLNQKDDGYVYRLPTEAEWEYASRVGGTRNYTANLDAMAWHARNADGKTHDVGTKQSNSWELFDMLGNVWEWCQDWYDRAYYASSPVVDPQGPPSGVERVIRGGAWFADPSKMCRSENRNHAKPSFRSDQLGLRLVRTLR